MLSSPGIRLSLAGAAVFGVSLVAMLFLPKLLGVVGMTIGATGVFAGFLWTIFSYYVSPPAP